jgi:hypothetical protein
MRGPRPGRVTRHPTEWEDEEKRNSDALSAAPPEGPMSAAEALAASGAELPAPDMNAALRDRIIDLATTGRDDPPQDGGGGTSGES